MGPMGPRGPWAHKTKMFSLLALAGFQTTFWDFGHVKTFLLALAGFQTTFGDFGHLKVDVFDYVRNKAMLVLVFYFSILKHVIFDKIWTC